MEPEVKPAAAVITDAQMEEGRRLAEIFMPYAASRRDDVVSKNGRFVHYTSAANALNIINSKTLWMRNTTCMTDYSEVMHGFNRLNDHPNTKQYLDFLNAEFDNLGKESADLFNSWWNDTQTQTFITSISEHRDNEDIHGRLSMWRAFSKGNARVALVIRLPLTNRRFAQSLKLLFSPVAYFTEGELGTELERVVTSVREHKQFIEQADRSYVRGAVFYMLMLAVICLKHEGFEEEREWRIIYGPKRMPSAHIGSDVEVVDGVPQNVYKIPLNSALAPDLKGIDVSDLLDRVIIGPSPFPWVMYDSFVTALTAAGVPNAAERVFISGIPIRT
jgi:hypothetical protein